MNARDNYYKASLGGGTVFLIVLTCLRLIIFILIALFAFPIGTIIGIIYFTAHMCGYFFVPKGYRVTDEFVIIERPGRNIRIRLSDIAKIEYHKKWRFHYYGVLSYGGLFGYARIYFHGKEYGWVREHSKRLSKMVVISTKLKRNFVIGPQHPEEFLSEVERIMSKIECSKPKEIETMEFSCEDEDTEEGGFAKVIDY